MILLQLNAKPLRTGAVNPKNYPFGDELVYRLATKYKDIYDEEVIEINKPIPFKESVELVKRARVIICIDSYLQHLAWSLGKKAIVLWGQSDPKIFGHKENINLLKDRKYLRKYQHDIWEYTDFNQTVNNPDAFVDVEEVLKCIESK